MAMSPAITSSETATLPVGVTVTVHGDIPSAYATPVPSVAFAPPW